jgi:hypothetical protein
MADVSSSHFVHSAALIFVRRRRLVETRADNSSLSRDLAPSVELLAIARVTPSRDRPIPTARREG